jgi:DNA-binding response OmpR family regulator
MCKKVSNMVQMIQETYKIWHNEVPGGKMQALLVSEFDDESAVLSLILQKAGFTVRALRDLSSLFTSWPEQPVDFIMIALNETRAESLKNIHQIRQHTEAPIMMITDPLAESYQVNLLEAGIDYLIIRPYGIRYILAVINGLSRRSQGISLFNLPALSQGGVTLDQSARMVTVNEGEPVRLTHLEFRLLHTLITNPGQVIPTENLVEYVWGYSGAGDRDLVRGLVQRLRSKVEPDPHQPRHIITHPSLGYSFQTKSPD